MMYRMKKIIHHDDEIILPKCMYRIKNLNSSMCADESNINISDQAPNKKMAELEQRQDQLLKKLDILYERIKTISSICTTNTVNLQESKNRDLKQEVAPSDDIVVVLSPDNLPWFLNYLLKESSLAAHIMWHIHSTVPNEKVAKIKAFMKKLDNIQQQRSKISLRLIFKNVSADSELKLSSLTIPIVGNVNILRYLSQIYPKIIPYQEYYQLESLLDLCHLLERTSEKNRLGVINKIFTQNKVWIYKNEFSIVDIAVYNVIKQWQNSAKYVPKKWYEESEKKFG